jgi:hypothetical protein
VSRGGRRKAFNAEIAEYAEKDKAKDFLEIFSAFSAIKRF